MLSDDEKKRLKLSLIPPLLFVFVLWIVWIIDSVENLDLYRLGIYPRDIKGIIGIVLSPLVHDSIGHLFANTMPLIILGTGIVYFYRTLAYKVFLVTWVAGGICVWIGARENYHIGASGLIYGVASFLFFSGVIRRDIRLAAISLLVVFLYGSMIWGIFPIYPRVSWESHFFGGFCGLVLSILYRKQGPQRKEVDWGEDDSEEVLTENQLKKKNDKNDHISENLF